MKISINWLKDYINLKEKPEEIAEALTMGIAEVEEVKNLSKGLENVVVGQIKEIKKHPNADRLFVSKIDIGKSKPLQIIFSPVVKLKVGDKLPIAVAPTKLPTGLDVKKVKLRGIESEGMCCLNKELGILDKSKQVYFFDKSVRNGTKIAKALGLEDYLLEIDNKSLTHRSDLFSHIGIARELSAILGKKLKLPKSVLISKKKDEQDLEIEVRDKKLCSRYIGVVLDNIKIGQSPKWLQNRLAICGIRPINNIVDITNYVMLEWGQPLHAFDFEKIKKVKGKTKIIIRKAKKNESLVTLDGQKRILDSSMLVIADQEKPIALAGIMGGANTEVSDQTKMIVLESATFDPFSVRRTSQKLGLRTEAVTRFEKNLGIELSERGLLRACQLFQKYAGARMASKIQDSLTKKIKPPTIKLDLDYLDRLIGQKIPKTKITKILKSLEFRIKETSKKLEVIPPLFRTDIHIQEDLIEEVARIYGYGEIKEKSLFGVLKPTKELPDLYWRDKIIQILIGMGFSQVDNYSFYGEKLLVDCQLTPKDHLTLANPLSRDLKYLRTSLLPYLFDNLRKNIKKFSQMKIFEIGHVYFEGFECKEIGAVICGKKENVFYQLKGVVEVLLDKLEIDFQIRPLIKTENCQFWNMYADNKCVQINSGEKLLGTLSLLDKKVLNNFKLGNRNVAFFSLSLDQIAKLANSNIRYNPLPKYPPAILDLAFVLEKDIPTESVTKAMYEAGKPYLVQVELFDVYTGKPLEENQKNLAFHLTYQAPDRTLKDKEVKESQNRIAQILKDKFKAQVRKF